MRILVIADEIPLPPYGGSPVYTYNLLKRVAAEHDVWHMAFTTTLEQVAGAEQLRTCCREVITVPLGESKALDRPFDLVRYLAAGKPPDTRFLFSRDFARQVRQLVKTINFDIVQIEHSDMGQYLEEIPRVMWPRTIWMLHDVDWPKYARIAQLEAKRSRKLRLQLHSIMMRYWKPRHAMHFGHCTTISDRDRLLMLQANPQLQVTTILAGVDTRQLQPLPYQESGPACIFVGNMNYLPNCDAALYFCREVLPLIQRAIPEIRVWIVGANPRPEVKALAGDNIYVTGAVEDLQSYYARSPVCIMPVRAGGGARLKILEAMALGRPVVTTSIGCEGQDVIDGKHVLIGDEPSLFAEHVIRLLTDSSLRQQITQQARALVVEHYDWDVSAKRLLGIYNELVGTVHDRS